MRFASRTLLLVALFSTSLFCLPSYSAMAPRKHYVPPSQLEHRGPVRPYAVGGIGLIRPHVSSLASSVTSFSNNSFGWDLGGGLTILFGGRVGIRGDLRKFHTMQDVDLLIFTGQKLDFWRASVGLALAF